MLLSIGYLAQGWQHWFLNTMKNRRRKIVVIGLGEFGRRLVPSLYSEGHEVLAIDSNMEQVEAIKDQCTVAVCIDCTDEKAMRELDLASFDTAIIAISENFETLLVAADILKKIGITEIIARYRSELQKRILNMLGIQEIFNPEQKAAASMAEMFRYEGVHDSFLVGQEYRIVEVAAPEGIHGLKVGDLDIREKYQLNLITIRRRLKDKTEKKVLGIPQKDSVIYSGDDLLLFGKTEHIDRFLDDYN